MTAPDQAPDLPGRSYLGARAAGVAVPAEWRHELGALTHPTEASWIAQHRETDAEAEHADRGIEPPAEAQQDDRPPDEAMVRAAERFIADQVATWEVTFAAGSGQVVSLSDAAHAAARWHRVLAARPSADTETRPHCSTCICGRRAPVQGERENARGALRAMPPGTVAWPEHEQAYVPYAGRFGTGQSSERLAERGGFGYWELTELLGHEPTTWSAR